MTGDSKCLTSDYISQLSDLKKKKKKNQHAHFPN